MTIPASLIHRAVPVLPAADLARTNQFYRDRLQFNTIHYGDYLSVSNGQAEIHFYESKTGAGSPPASCCLLVTDIEEAYAFFASRDVIAPGHELNDPGRGRKGFSILDNSGNIIRFRQA